MCSSLLLADFPEPAPPAAADTATFSRYCQRSMRLLATSTAEHRNRVRILFYGQSITKQDWWMDVRDDLCTRFPHADIVAENRAIGGFSSQRLIWTVARDVGEFHPDLLIFHVYGAHDKYEEIIRWVRANTTAEIVMQSDHLNARTDPTKPDEAWGAFMNGRFLPAIARAYACDLVDIRAPWRQYLLKHDYPSAELLRDGVHLNEHGCFLMGRLTARALVYLPDVGAAPADRWIRDVHVGHDLQAQDGRLRLTFSGNRVEAMVTAPVTADVRIDGRPPSAFPELYTFTRPNAGPGVDWPWHVSAPVQVGWEQPPVEETWTVTLTEGDAEAFRFRIRGSVTGPDGTGSSGERFVSDSGRVVIDPEHWWRQPPRGQESPLKPGYELRFERRLLGIDKLVAGDVEDTTRDHTVVLAQGLANGEHMLELTAADLSGIAALRVHEPPLKSTDDDARVAKLVSPHGQAGTDAERLPAFISVPVPTSAGRSAVP